MALLLAQIMRYQPLLPVVEAADLARVLLLALSSPLAQNRDARSRLLSAVRPSSAGTTERLSVEPDEETIALFGLPQTTWPRETGWLDGLFELVHCCTTHPVSGINLF